MLEIREWWPGSTKVKGDGLDAVAGALSQQHVQMERIYGGGHHSWMPGAKTHKAKTDFDV